MQKFALKCSVHLFTDEEFRTMYLSHQNSVIRKSDRKPFYDEERFTILESKFNKRNFHEVFFFVFKMRSEGSLRNLMMIIFQNLGIQ